MTVKGRTNKAVEVQVGLGDIAARIDESHLALWSTDVEAREVAADEVTRKLRNLSEGQVVTLPGKIITDLNSLRHELDRALPSAEGRVMRSTIDGPVGLLARLREPPHMLPDGHHVKWRYYVWRDADVLLRSSPAAFSVMVDAVAGVAAEAEFVSDDLLLIQRLVLVGGPLLAETFCDERGPLRAWRPGSPWARMTRQERPRFECHEVGKKA